MDNIIKTMYVKGQTSFLNIMFLLIWNLKFYLLLDTTLIKAFRLHYDCLLQSRSSELPSIWHNCFKFYSCKSSSFSQTSGQGHPSLCESPTLQLASAEAKEKSTPKGSMLPLYERDNFHRRQHAILAALLSQNAHLFCFCFMLCELRWRYLLIILVVRLSLMLFTHGLSLSRAFPGMTITLVPSM